MLGGYTRVVPAECLLRVHGYLVTFEELGGNTCHGCRLRTVAADRFDADTRLPTIKDPVRSHLSDVDYSAHHLPRMGRVPVSLLSAVPGL